MIQRAIDPAQTTAPASPDRWPETATRQEGPFSVPGLLAEARVPRIDLRMDYENLHIAMKERGYALDPGRLLRALRAALQPYGEVITSKAYADWGLLDPLNGLALQKSLAEEGVDVTYVANQRGKNTADMRIVRDLRDSLELAPYNSRQFEFLAIASGDRDFTDIIFSARERGKPVLVLGFRGSLSGALARSASRVIYLDEYFVNRRVSARDPLARLAVQAVALARRASGGHFRERDLLQALGGPGARAEIGAAFAQGLLAYGEKAGEMIPNAGHPLVKAASFLAEWAPEKVEQGLNRPGFRYVDTNYLANGANYDPRLCGLGIMGGRQEIAGWLDLLAGAGILEKTRRPSDRDPGRDFSTWWAPGMERKGG